MLHLVWNFLRRIRRHRGFIISYILLWWGLWLCWSVAPWNIAQEAIVINAPASKPTIQPKAQIVARAYYPNTPGPYPTAILMHGVDSTKEFLTPIALELAHHNIAAVTYDSGGFGESYDRPFSETGNVRDLETVIRHLRNYPEKFNTSDHGIALVGHSMGAATALQIIPSRAKPIHAVVMLSMSGEVTPTQPPNLLMAAGLYDQLHPKSAMAEMYQQATGNAEGATPSKTLSDRQLTISPTADHAIALYDRTLIRATVDWVTAKLGVDKPLSELQAHRLIAGRWLILLGSLGSVVFWSRDWRSGRTRYLGWGITGLVLVTVGCGMAGRISGFTASNIILLGAAAIPLAQYSHRYAKPVTAEFAIGLLRILIIWLSFMLITILPGIPHWRGISELGNVAQFLLNWPMGFWDNTYQPIRAELFPVYSYGFRVSFWIPLLFLPELIWPGGIVTIVRKSCRWLFRWIRRPLAFQGVGQVSRKTLALIASLIVALGIILWMQFQANVLSSHNMLLAFQVAGRLFVLPAVVSVSILRSQWYQRLEKRLAQHFSNPQIKRYR